MSEVRVSQASVSAAPHDGDEGIALLRPQPGSRVSPATEAPEVAAMRRAAERALAQWGLPGRKDEAWRFTPVRSALELSPSEPADVWDLERAGAEVRARFAADAVVLPVVDGLPLVTAVEGLPAGVQLMGLDDALAGSVAPEPVALTQERHFRALNTARFERGGLLRVEGEQEHPIHVLYVSTGATVSHARLHVELVRGARASVIEHFVSAKRTDEAAKTLLNAVTDVRVGANAELEHVRVHRSAQQLVGDVAVEVGADARYHSRVVTLGGPLMRLSLHVAFVGKGGSATLDGAYHVAGRDLVDHHTRVEHRAPHCTSHQDYRGVVDEKGTSVFDGIAWVHEAALVSEAHQQNRNLLLTDTAVAHTKPHLEIDTDSVVASHGATVGTLDEDQVFYLRSRGLRDSQARALLTFAFVRELLARISDEGTRHKVEEEMAARLPDGQGLLELFGEVE
ncbi:MAG: Fe-S cluster assembly protein SufD [Myxococcales bacterium]|nr:Fe-S cluster assembly protein SufD [Myxococcales bacterium]